MFQKCCTQHNLKAARLFSTSAADLILFVRLDLEWLACPTIEPLQWKALARSTSVQKANPQKAGPLHNAPTGQPLQLAQTSRTTMLKLASVRLCAEQEERSAKLLNRAGSCLSAANCLWQSCWPHFRGLPLAFPLYLILPSFLYYNPPLPSFQSHFAFSVIAVFFLPIFSHLPFSLHSCAVSAPHARPGHLVILCCFWYSEVQHQHMIQHQIDRTMSRLRPS